MTNNPNQTPTTAAKQWPFPLPGVLAIIMQPQADGPRYLLIRRKKEPYIGRWALIGGKWDYGETLAEAAEREVREETTLETTFAGLRAVVSERVVNPDESQVNAHYLILLCTLIVTSGTAQEQGEGAVAWFTRQDIEALHQQQLFVPSDYAMLNTFADALDTVPTVEVKMRAALDGVIGGAVELLQFERFRS